MKSFNDHCSSTITEAGEHFVRYFSLKIANTPDLLQEVFKIRYQVYCQELRYESSEQFPDGLEKDIYDRRSIHCLLQHRPSGSYAGCVRAILDDPDAPEEPFPFEIASGHRLDFRPLPRKNFFEASRLAVLSTFRRRERESENKEGRLIMEEAGKENWFDRRRFPLIALSLHLACFSLAITLDRHFFGIMEKKLARHLQMVGLPSEQVGDFVNHHGLRAPFYFEPHRALASLAPQNYYLFVLIHALVRDELNSKSPALGDLGSRARDRNPRLVSIEKPTR